MNIIKQAIKESKNVNYKTNFLKDNIRHLETQELKLRIKIVVIKRIYG